MVEGKPVDKLTSAEVKLLATTLLSEHGNVYRVAEQMFNKHVEEEVFDQLQDEAGVFKCELCGRWLEVDEKCSYTSADTCEECVYAYNDHVIDDDSDD